MTEAPEGPLRPLRAEDVVDLEPLCTRLDRCVSVMPGPVDPDVLSVLAEHGYDQAPVYDPGSRCCWGLVETIYLKTLFEASQPLSADDPLVRDGQREFRVGPGATIFSLLAKMTAQRAVLVIRESDATEYGYAKSIYGLFTISDLNKHAIRSTIYRLLAGVESGLARWLERLMPDPWAWLHHLDEEQQARVLGYWELSKRQGVDVGPIAALTLAQLITVITRDSVAAERLGYGSRSQFAKATGQLPRVRNRVMHPVRPLILGHHSVNEVYRAVLVLQDLRERIDELLGEASER